MENKKDDNDKHVLSQVILTKPDDLIYLLSIINKYDRVSQADLKRKSKYSLGKIYPAVKALKAMKVVDNGKGIKINDDGKALLSAYSSDENRFKELLKKYFLNVRILSEVYNTNQTEKNPKILFAIFKNKLEKYDNISTRFIGSVVRRYLEGIHNIKLKAGAGISKSDDYKPVKRNYKIKNSDDKIDSIKKFRESFSLSGANLASMVDNLPKEKRDEIMSYVFEVM